MTVRKGKERLQFIKEGIQFRQRTFTDILNHAQRRKTFQVQPLTGHIELFIAFLTRGITFKINNRIYLAVIRHFGSISSGFFICSTLFLFIAQSAEETVTDRRKSDHLFLTQLWKENLSVIPKNTGKHTDLAAFFR